MGSVYDKHTQYSLLHNLFYIMGLVFITIITIFILNLQGTSGVDISPSLKLIFCSTVHLTDRYAVRFDFFEFSLIDFFNTYFFLFLLEGYVFILHIHVTTREQVRYDSQFKLVDTFPIIIINLGHIFSIALI